MHKKGIVSRLQQRGQGCFSGGDYFVTPDVKFRIFHLTFRMGENVLYGFADSLIGALDRGEDRTELLYFGIVKHDRISFVSQKGTFHIILFAAGGQKF